MLYMLLYIAINENENENLMSHLAFSNWDLKERDKTPATFLFEAIIVYA